MFPLINKVNCPRSSFLRTTIKEHGDRWFGKVAVVTGASAGIGAAITEALVKEGVLVVGLARRLERLQKLSSSFEGAKGKLYARRCDVSKANEILHIFEWVNNELGGVDILVNNAGIVFLNRPVIEGDINEFQSILDVNVLASAVCIREAVASMRSRNVAGHIINLNSIDGHFLPSAKNTSLYYSSKFAITAMTEVVRKELVLRRKLRLRVSPGFVKTEIMAVAGVANPNEFFETVPHMQAKDIADAVLYILGTPENVQVTELTIRPVGEKC